MKIVKDKVMCSPQFFGDKFYGVHIDEITSTIHLLLGILANKSGVVTSNFKTTIEISPCVDNMALEIKITDTPTEKGGGDNE